MPGLPPMSTVMPEVSPPPRTRSSSSMPVEVLLPAWADTSFRGTAFMGAEGAFRLTRSSSTMVFQLPHWGHRPIQRGVS